MAHKREMIEFIIANKDVIKQREQMVPAYLEGLTINYLAKLY